MSGSGPGPGGHQRPSQPGGGFQSRGGNPLQNTPSSKRQQDARGGPMASGQQKK